MENGRKLRAYERGAGDVFLMNDITGGYHQLKCAYKKEFCSSDCAFFCIRIWQSGHPIFCGNMQIGILD